MGFFYLKKPRKFNYTPVYYDEDKEIREEIIANAKRDLGIKDEHEEYKPQIKGKFKQQKRQDISLNFKRKEEKKSNGRLILLVGLLLMLVYFIFLR